MSDAPDPAAPDPADLLRDAAAGDDAAAGELVGRYDARLRRLAASRLPRSTAARVDAGDVTQSAWRSFFAAAGAGRVRPTKPGDLWRVLAKITVRKALRQIRRHTAAKRDVRAEAGDAATSPAPAAAGAGDVGASLVSAEEFAALRADLPPAVRPTLDLLRDGHGPGEIAAVTGRNGRTVRRDLARVRDAVAARNPLAVPAAERYGDYLLHRMIGAGATGKVYRATHRPTGTAVAVKYLRKSLVGDVAAMRRFRAEAAVVLRLRHPGIVPVRGCGRTPAGGWFLVLDLVDGPDLRSVSDRGPVSVADAVRWTADAADAVAHAHARGVTHADLKPANLLLAPDGRVRVTDFGLARTAASDRGTPAGTAAFLAPEQADPRWGPVTTRTDLFGLGAVLFALLTARPPRTGGTAEELAARAAAGDPVPPVASLRPDVPMSVAAPCDRCLRTRPADRPGSAAGLAKALRAAARG